MTELLDMPYEVISAIAECSTPAAYDPQNTDSFRMMASKENVSALSLTCHRIRQAALPHLFRELKLTSTMLWEDKRWREKPRKPLPGENCYLHSPILTNSLRIIRVDSEWIVSTFGPYVKQIHWQSWSIIADILMDVLHRCPNLITIADLNCQLMNYTSLVRTIIVHPSIKVAYILMGTQLCYDDDELPIWSNQELLRHDFPALTIFVCKELITHQNEPDTSVVKDYKIILPWLQKGLRVQNLSLFGASQASIDWLEVVSEYLHDLQVIHFESGHAHNHYPRENHFYCNKIAAKLLDISQSHTCTLEVNMMDETCPVYLSHWMLPYTSGRIAPLNAFRSLKLEGTKWISQRDTPRAEVLCCTELDSVYVVSQTFDENLLSELHTVFSLFPWHLKTDIYFKYTMKISSFEQEQQLIDILCLRTNTKDVNLGGGIVFVYLQRFASMLFAKLPLLETLYTKGERPNEPGSSDAFYVKRENGTIIFDEVDFHLQWCQDTLVNGMDDTRLSTLISDLNLLNV